MYGEPQVLADMTSQFVTYGIGVGVPAMVSLIGVWAAKRSAWYAALRHSDKGKAFRNRLESEVERRALAKYTALLHKRADKR